MANFVSSAPGTRFPTSYWQPASARQHQDAPRIFADDIPLRQWQAPIAGYDAPYGNAAPPQLLLAPNLASRRALQQRKRCALVGLGLASACVVGGLVAVAVLLIRSYNSAGAGDGDGVLGGVAGGGNNSALANTNLVAVPLTGCPATNYAAPFVIGGQNFQLTIDSGSSTTGIASSKCINCNGVSPQYKPGSGASNAGATVTSSYGDGSGWSGTIYGDTMAAGDNATASVNVNVVAITEQTGFFKPSGCSIQGREITNQGIAGLGPADLDLPGTNAFVLQWAQATHSPAAFTFAPCDVGGSMWFGGYNPNAVTQMPQFVPMASIDSGNPYYAVNVGGVRLGAMDIASSSNALGTTLMDTGTSLFVLPQSTYDAFTQALSQSAAFTAAFPSLLSNSDSVVLVANGMSRSQLDQALPPLMVDIDDGNGGYLTLTLPATSSYLLPLPKNAGSSTADAYSLGISPTSGGPTIFGGGTMRALMVVFDPQNGQMGFAPQGTCKGNLT